MPRMIRSLATLLILLVTATTAWGAGEREVTIAQGIDAEFLDVQMTNNVATILINGSIYDTLMTRDKQLQIVPHLAPSYKLVSDKVWEVKLRPGVKFHNGEPRAPPAVRFSAERIKRPDLKAPQKGWFSPIEQVEIVDPFTVRFPTKVPDPAMPARMTLMFQMPPKYIGQVGDAQANLKPVGTGAFKFVEWQKNERIVVEANDAHWTGKPAVRRATWRPIPELGSRIAALQTGQADLIVNVPPDQIAALSPNKNIRIEKTPSCRIVSFAIAQIKGGALGDKRVRQALNHAVDMQAILDAVLLGNGKRLNSWMPPNVWGYDPSIPVYEYNPKKAKELLAAAGQSNITLTLQAPNGRWAMDKDIAQAVAGQLLRLIRDDAPYIFGYQQMDIYGVNARLKWTPRGDESIRLTEISF